MTQHLKFQKNPFQSRSKQDEFTPPEEWSVEKKTHIHKQTVTYVYVYVCACENTHLCGCIATASNQLQKEQQPDNKHQWTDLITKRKTQSEWKEK